MPKRKLNILFTILYFPPAWGYGGPVKVAYNYAKELVARGHRVTVYTTDTLDSISRIYRKHNIIEDIEVFYLSNISNFLASKKIFLTPLFPFLVKKNINKFDLVHCFDFRNLQNIFLHRYATQNNIPYYISVFGQVNKGRGLLSIIKFFYDIFFGNKILEDSSSIFAQNDHEKQTIGKLHLSKNKIESLPLAVDLTEFESLPPNGEFRRKYGIKESDFLILFVGRIHYLKGIDFLINALPVILKKIKNSKLVIVGRDDGYLSVLKSLTRENNLEKYVIFTGPIYEKERISIYNDANVFIITPRFPEETSLASLEAAACGTPIIVNENCQVPHLEVLKCGVTLRNNSPQSIAKAIYYVSVRQKSMGKMAREMISMEFSLKKVVDNLENIYYKEAFRRNND